METVPSTGKIILLFFNLSQSGLARNEAKIFFFNFLNYFPFLKFFSKCSSLGQAKIVPENECFFNLFFDLSQLDLSKNEARMTFFNFLNFYTILFWAKMVHKTIFFIW